MHGDDFVESGEPVDLAWMRNELESKLYINTDEHDNIWGRTRYVEGGEDIEWKALLALWSRDIL